MSSEPLSPTERACLTLLSQGKRPKEICAALNIKQPTYSTYMMRARYKLGARTPTQAAVLFALEERK
jgi:DNA-binding CsgD family transcriptional regulator